MANNPEVADFIVQESESPLAQSSIDLARLSDQQVNEMIAGIERAADVQKRMIMAAMTHLYPKDFIDFNGKPFLQAIGAERLCRSLHIKLSEPIFETIWEEDDCFVHCLMSATWAATSESVTKIGAANTRDKLWDTGDPDDRSYINQCRQRTGGNEKLSRQMVAQFVKKKALANATGRAVCAVLGIGGLTWEQLAEIGFTPDKAAAKVSYKKGATKETTKAAKQESQHVVLADLVNLPVGSVVNCGGMIKWTKQKDKSHAYMIDDGTLPADKAVYINVRSTDSLPEYAVKDREVYFHHVEVTEWQGRSFYWAGRIEEVTYESTEGMVGDGMPGPAEVS